MNNYVFPAYVEKRFVVVVEIPFTDSGRVLDTGYVGTIEQAREECEKYRNKFYPMSSQDTLFILEIQTDGSAEVAEQQDPICI